MGSYYCLCSSSTRRGCYYGMDPSQYKRVNRCFIHALFVLWEVYSLLLDIIAVCLNSLSNYDDKSTITDCFNMKQPNRNVNNLHVAER